MSQAKRPSNFNDGNTSKAPDNYQVRKADKKKFIESSKQTPSARRANTQIILESGFKTLDSSDKALGNQHDAKRRIQQQNQKYYQKISFLLRP